MSKSCSGSWSTRPRPAASRPPRVVERLAVALEAAGRLVILDALSEAVGEITRELTPGSVDLRLRGRDVEFAVFQADRRRRGRAAHSARPAGARGGRRRHRQPHHRAAARRAEGPGRPGRSRRRRVLQHLAGAHRRGRRGAFAPRGPHVARFVLFRVAARMTVFAVTGPPEIQVKIQVGRVDIIATDRGDVVVTVSPSNPSRSGDRSAAEHVRIDQVGGAVRVTGPARLNLFGPGDSVDVLVEVPVDHVRDRRREVRIGERLRVPRRLPTERRVRRRRGGARDPARALRRLRGGARRARHRRCRAPVEVWFGPGGPHRRGAAAQRGQLLGGRRLRGLHGRDRHVQWCGGARRGWR